MSSRANIGIFVASDLSKTDGTTVRARTVRSILNRHFHVSVAGVSTTNLDEPNVLIVKVPRRDADLFRQLMQLPYWLLGVTRILFGHKFDVIYVCNDWFGFLAYLLARALFKEKVIFEAQGLLSEETEQWGKPSFLARILAYWERFVLGKCDLVVALSGHIFEFCKRYTRKLELIPVFVDTSVYRRNEANRIAIREKYRWQRGSIVGLIGPFDNTWNEGALQFLSKSVQEFDQRIEFVVIGKCDQKVKIAKCSYVGFVEDLAGFLSGIDAVLVARRRSTSGPLNKIIYPMSCSLPVFTTPEGVVGMDYVKNGRDIIVAKEDEMAGVMNSILFNRRLMSTVGSNARRTVERYYSHTTNAHRLGQIINSAF